MSDLPPELLSAIARKLTEPTDLIRFRSVSSCWRSATSSLPMPEPRLPWFFLCFKPDELLCYFYSFSEDRIYKIHSPDGWESGDLINLYNGSMLPRKRPIMANSRRFWICLLVKRSICQFQINYSYTSKTLSYSQITNYVIGMTSTIWLDIIFYQLRKSALTLTAAWSFRALQGVLQYQSWCFDASIFLSRVSFSEGGGSILLGNHLR